MLRATVLTLAGLALAGPAPAQLARYELGRRLRLLERSFELASDAARTRAAGYLEGAVLQFFTLNPPGAMSALERAHWTLTHDGELPTERLFAASWTVDPERRLVTAGEAGPLRVTVRPVFEVELDRPPRLVGRVRWEAIDDWEQRVELGEDVREIAVAAPCPPAGQQRLRLDVLAAGDVVASVAVEVSVVPDLRARLDALPEGAAAGTDLEGATLARLSQLLRGLADGRTPELDTDAGALLAEAELLARSPADRPRYAGGPAGDFLLSVSVGDHAIPLRLFVPGRERGARMPLVLALHGVGGSENMFFAAYGDGKIVELARERGWMVAAPRMSRTPLPALIAALDRRWPVDRERVFVVGHSAGAVRLVDALVDGSRLAAVALLGLSDRTGRRHAGTADLANVRCFVGVGDRDALVSRVAKANGRFLADLGAEVEERVYPGIGHMTIVQVALPDVFAFFDRTAK